LAQDYIIFFRINAGIPSSSSSSSGAAASFLWAGMAWAAFREDILGFFFSEIVFLSSVSFSEIKVLGV